MKPINNSARGTTLQDTASSSHVLAVDDAPDNLLLIEAILSGSEYSLTCAQNGSEALEKVSLRHPDVILLDVSMPDMSGFEVTEQIRQDESLPYIPILLVTANDRDSCRRGLKAGADDYIRKPYRIEELELKVKSLLRHQSMRRKLRENMKAC